jgi:transposase
MYEQITVKTLAKQNKKQTEIAVELGCHRNTVRNIINRPSVIEKATRDKPSYFDQYHDQIKTWVDKKVSHRRIFELLGEKYTLERRYDSLCKYIQRKFPRVPEAYGVQVTSPGEMAEVDFGYAGLQPVNNPAETRRLAKTWFISVRLNYSRHAYREITHDQKVTTFIKAIDHAFTFFGGVPRRLKIDNLRAAVIKNQHYDLQFQGDFLDFMCHAGVVINPCTPYHPEQKGGVESDMKYIENNFLVERHFSDLPDLMTKFHDWSTNYANARIHGITKRVPSEVFLLEEKIALQSLPGTPYATYERCERKVASNCHVFLNNHYYSVPSKLVGQTVTLRFDTSLLKIIYQGEEVACHLKSSEIGVYTTNRSHLSEFKCYGQAEYQQKYEAKMADIGEAAHSYFQEVLLTKDSYWYRSVRTILGLSHEYGNEAVNLSLERAKEYKVLDTKIIKRIVSQQLYLLDSAPRLLSTLKAPIASPLPTVLPPSTFLNKVLEGVRATLGSPSSSPTKRLNNSLDRDLNYYQQLLGGET